jgi:hypothetical protein
LTFGGPGSRYPAPAAGPFCADIRRGFESPEQSSLVAAILCEEDWALAGLFGFLEIQHLIRLEGRRGYHDGVQPV